MFLETLYRIYTTPGYNIAHVDLTARSAKEHDIKPRRMSTASRRWSTGSRRSTRAPRSARA